MVLGPQTLEDQAEGRRVKTIVIIRFSSIGDIVLTNPVYRRLKETEKPGSVRLVAVVRKGFEMVLAANPYVDVTMIYDPARESLARFGAKLRLLGPSTVVDLHDNPRSRKLRTSLGAESILVYRKHTFKRILLVLFKINLLRSTGRVAERYLDALGDRGPRAPVHNFFVLPGRFRRFEAIWKRKLRGAIAVCGEATRRTKQWPYFNELVRDLIGRRGLKVVLIGRDRDRTLADLEHSQPAKFFNLTGKLDLLESAGIIGLSRIFVTNDTGLMHIADAMGKRTISIWGPTVPEFGFRPLGRNVTIVSNEVLKCRPCSLHGTKKCPQGHFRCMKTILPGKIAGLASKAQKR